jgi:ferredoxin
MARKKVVLSFPPDIVKKPITYHLVKDYDLIINILRAEIKEEEAGRMVLDIEGDEKNIENGLTFLREQGVGIQEAARDISLDTELCIDCGACTAVCLSQALSMNKDTWKLKFDKDNCLFCELCVKACPLQIIKVEI